MNCMNDPKLIQSLLSDMNHSPENLIEYASLAFALRKKARSILIENEGKKHD